MKNSLANDIANLFRNRNMTCQVKLSRLDNSLGLKCIMNFVLLIINDQKYADCLLIPCIKNFVFLKINDQIYAD